MKLTPDQLKEIRELNSDFKIMGDYCVSDILDHIEVLERENQMLLETVSREPGEWRLNPNFGNKYCPVCHYSQKIGHLQECPLNSQTAQKGTPHG